jgi:eukaryotic-like serine/threonine-protein kinase
MAEGVATGCSRAIITALMALASGTKLGPYEILALLGTGGMGEVYRALDTSLGREVAVKILHAGTLQDPDRLRRFRQEAQSAASLNHPNILAIHFVGEHDGAPFIVSELLEGENLRERLRRERLPLRKCLDFATQVIDGLVAAHEKGIVHRDLKPENIFLTRDGRVKILDFGLAKLIALGNTSADANAVTMTQVSSPGVVLGTVGYMSPEQVRSQPLDARSDIFSFGVMFYEMLSGKNVFLRATGADTMSALLNEDPPELTQSSPGVSPGLDRIVRRCLEKEPADRFQSVRDLGFALQAVTGSNTSAAAPTAASSPIPSKKIAALGLFAVAILVTGLGAYLFGHSRPSLAPSAQPEFHQLTFRLGTIGDARFAPDGQTIIYGASMDGAVSRLYSTRNDSPESQALEPGSIGLFAVSPTGELAVAAGCKYLGNARCSGVLARMPLSGGAPREVLPDVTVADWLPDRKELAVVRRSRGHVLVEFPIGKALFSTPGGVNAMRVSPDGKYVAFAANPTLGNDAGEIIIFDTQGKEVARAGPWNSIEGIAWVSSGTEVWFAASAGNEGWADQIRALDLSGRQRMILRLPGITRLHDISRDDRVLITKEQWRSLMPFKGPNDGKDRDLSWFDLSAVCDIALDSQSVIFTEIGQAPGQDYFLYQRKTDGSPAVKLGDGFTGAISPDGKWVLSVSAENPARLVLLPAGAGNAKRLPGQGLTQFSGPSWFPDGKRVAYEASDGHAWRAYVQDLDGGIPRAISTELSAVSPYETQLVSPDGKYVFGRDLERKCFRYPLDGSSSIEIPGLQPEESFAGWAGDSHSIFLFSQAGYPVKVFKLDVSTGTRKVIREIMPEDAVGLDALFALRVSGDEKSFAYSYQRSLSELYLVSGLK